MTCSKIVVLLRTLTKQFVYKALRLWCSNLPIREVGYIYLSRGLKSTTRILNNRQTTT